MPTERLPQPVILPRPRARRSLGTREMLAMGAAAVCLVSCGATPGRASGRTPSKTEVGTLVSATSAFQEPATVRVPRAISIEPRIGEGAAAAFAASLGRDILAGDALRSLAPGVAALHDALLVRVDDSPISEQFDSNAPMEIGQSASGSTLSVPGHQRARRYWRHYLRIEPVDLGSEDWISETGGDEIDETSTPAHVVRTPGWKAAVGRRELVAVDSVHASGDSLSVVYRWHWVPTELGAPFMSRDTLTPDHLAASYAEAPLLSPVEHRATAGFVRTRDGWVPTREITATSANGSTRP